jgi:4'-phosphopantetheinyl transferase
MAIRPDASFVECPLDAVHVWYLFTDRVTDPQILERYASMMSTDERARRARFVFAKDRHQFLVTRGLVRTVLSRYARIRPEECTFAANQYGKPSLRQSPSAEPGIEFNVSHTNGLVAVAVAAGREIGIDVEELTRAGLELDVRRFFSAAEVRALEALPEAEQKSRFFDYWTVKEAYIKALGMGLSCPLDSFSIHFDRGGPPTIEFAPDVDDDASRWQFAQFDPSPRHRMALAIRRHESDVAVRIHAFDANGGIDDIA